jgi:very-short-patch-repair endonuclease
MSKHISDAEENLWKQIRIKGLPLPKREYEFCPGRKWRFDFAWIEQKLAVEVEGGNWSGGRHTRGRGFEQDCEKYNAAILMGWRVLRFTPKSMTWTNWEAVEVIQRALLGVVNVAEQAELQQLGIRAEGMGG